MAHVFTVINVHDVCNDMLWHPLTLSLSTTETLTQNPTFTQTLYKANIAGHRGHALITTTEKKATPHSQAFKNLQN